MIYLKKLKNMSNYDYCDFRYLPEHLKTRENLASSLFYYGGEQIIYAKPELLSLDFIERHFERFTTDKALVFVISKFPTCFKRVKNDKKTQELCDIAFEKDVKNFEYIPHEFQSLVMVEKAIYFDYTFLKYVAPKLKTLKTCLKVSQKSGYKNILYIDRKYHTAEMVEQYIEYTSSLKGIDLNLATPKLIYDAVCRNYKNIEYVPRDKQTLEMIKQVIAIEDYDTSSDEKSYYFSKYVHPSLFTIKIFNTLFSLKQSHTSLIRNYKIIRKEAFIYNYTFLRLLLKEYGYSEEIVNYIPIENLLKLDANILESIISRNNKIVAKFPREFINTKMFRNILEKNVACLEYIKPDNISKDVIIYLICRNEKLFKQMPKKFHFDEAVDFAIKLNSENIQMHPVLDKIDENTIIKYIPNNNISITISLVLNDEIIINNGDLLSTMVWIEKVNILKYNKIIGLTEKLNCNNYRFDLLQLVSSSSSSTSSTSSIHLTANIFKLINKFLII